MSILIEDFITDLQSAITASNAGLESVPDHPPESIADFPACIAYLDSFKADVLTPGLTKFFHTVIVEVHIGGIDLPADTETIIDYVERIPKTIFKTLSSFSKTNIRFVGQINYQFGEMAWRNQKTLGYLFQLNDVMTESYTSQDAPTAPSSLVATAISASEINLTWTDNSDNELAFVVQRSLTSGSGFVTIAILASGSTSYSDTGLSGGTAYYYQIVANNSGGNTTSNEATDTTYAVLVLDTFTGAPISLDAHTPDTDASGLGWTEVLEDWGLDGSGNAVTAAIGLGIASIDSTAADGVITANLTTTSFTFSAVRGVVARFIDTNNYWQIGLSDNSFYIRERNAGVTVNRAAALNVGVGASTPVEMVVTMLGTTITAELVGVATISYSSATLNQTETTHGMIVRFNDEPYDRFKVVG
jgi:hypothetical protein